MDQFKRCKKTNGFKQSFENKRAAIAFASPQIKEFISLLKSSGADILAIADKDKTLHAKVIDKMFQLTRNLSI